MKFIDLFSGIGGFRSALEELGHECIASSEIDKFAIQSYKALYDTEDEIELGDISKISDDYIEKLKGEVDIVVGGSPCQSFSIAGNRGGFDDTRGTLFFEYARTVKDIQPKYFIFENVKGMISHDKGNTIRTVLNTFNDLGYYIDFNIFNSKYYDVPQNRERIYIVGKRKDLVSEPKFHANKKRKVKLDEIHNWAVENIQYVDGLLPELKTVVNKRLVDVLEDEVDEKYYLDEEKTKRLLERIKNREIKNNFNKQVADYRYDEGLRIREEGISPCLTANLKSMGTDNKNLSNAVYVVDNEITKADGLYCNDSEGFFRGTVEGVSRTLKANNHDAGVGYEEPKITVVGNTSKTNHNSLNIYDSNGLAPTIAARDCNGPKQIAVREATKQGYAIAEQGVVINSKICRRCNSKLKPSDLEDYEYVCFECDENFYEFETKDEPKAIIGSTQKNAYVGNGSTSPSLTSAMGQGGGHVPMPVYSNLRIRKLTPLECWRLQGFTDEQFYKAQQAGLSNSQLYKQAGNAVTVNVVKYIAKKLFNE